MKNHYYFNNIIKIFEDMYQQKAEDNTDNSMKVTTRLDEILDYLEYKDKYSFEELISIIKEVYIAKKELFKILSKKNKPLI